MAPPFANNDGAGGVYAFPPPSMAASVPPFSGAFGSKAGGGATPAPSAGTAATSTATSTATAAAKPPPRYVCSPLPAAAASLNLRRRLMLPALAIPAALVTIPPLAVSILAILARLANATRGGRGNLPAIIAASSAILGAAWCMTTMGRGAIARHAPNEAAKKRALAQSAIALPFWALVLSICSVRALSYFAGGFASLFAGGEGGNIGGGSGWLGGAWGLTTTGLFWFVKIAGACTGPAVGWAVLSLLVVLRYAGPFLPIVRCSSTPLRTNPFDAALQRMGGNFTSKNRFLDFVTNGLDWLSALTAPSAPVKNDKAKAGEKAKAAPPAPNAGRAANNQRPFEPSNNDSLARVLGFLVKSSTARYSRPGLLSIVVQVVVNVVGGHLFAQAFVVPSLAEQNEMLVVAVVWLSCLFVPVFELFASVNEAELHYGYYSSVGGALGVGGRGFRLQPLLVALAKDAVFRVRRSALRVIVPAPLIAAATITLWSHLGHLLLRDGDGFSSMSSPPSSAAIVQSLLLSYLTVALLVAIMAVQDVLTRWSVCAPGMDVDVLMFQLSAAAPKGKDAAAAKKFLAEDLVIQSVLMGDGESVEKVIAPPGAKSALFTNPQEDEIKRNEAAASSFAQWIQDSSTTSSGKLSDDILRVCLLESLGGGGSASLTSNPFHFGDARHAAAIRKRLSLSAATAAPGQQPIAVPVVRALCAFAGGLGDAMSQIYRPVDKAGKPVKKNKSAELWKLPPGSLTAAEFAINAAARLVVMNLVSMDQSGHAFVDALKRHERLSLLLPCVLQSAHKLRCGMQEYARATASMYEVNVATFATEGKTDGQDVFIATKCPDLCAVIAACNDSARMIMKTLMESGVGEKLLLQRKWKGDMQKWLVGLNCAKNPALTN
ncbi:hypothetical protein ACHAXT_010681 [Thalassiosira profunda]